MTNIPKIKAISDARSVIRKEIQKLDAEIRGIENKRYKLQDVLDSMDRAEGLERIRRVRHKKTCPFCNEEFMAKKSDTIACSKLECQKKAKAKARKGTTILKGDEIKP